MAELVNIESALNAVLHAFNDEMADFYKGFGDFSIKNDSQCNRACTTQDSNTYTIHLSNNVFYQKGKWASDIIQIIVHEMGHLFDWHGSGGDPSQYKSQQFIDNNDINKGFCVPGPLGCLANEVPSQLAGVHFLYKAWNWIHGKGTGEGYDTNGTPSVYGATSSIDDYAESFAGYVLSNSGETNTIPPDVERSMVIQTDINKAGN